MLCRINSDTFLMWGKIMSKAIEPFNNITEKFEYLNYTSLDRTLLYVVNSYNFDRVNEILNEQISEKNTGML